MNAIAELVYSDPKAADRCILSVSELLRFSLESHRTQEVTLKEEIDFLEKYLGIQKMLEDLNAASVEDVAAFFKTYYAPNNAVLVLVGDFDTKQALTRIEKYFGDNASQPAPPPVVMNEPTQTAERRATVEDPLARLLQLDIAFKAAPGNTADFYAPQILATTLACGKNHGQSMVTAYLSLICTLLDSYSVR